MLYMTYFIIVSGHNIESFFAKFYCLRQVYLVENLHQATHTQDRVKTT